MVASVYSIFSTRALLVDKDKSPQWQPNSLSQVTDARVADYFEVAELLVTDALNRKESCGAHFREEYQTADGEAMRNDENFSYVAAWEYKGAGEPHILHKEELHFEEVEVKVRSYK